MVKTSCVDLIKLEFEEKIKEGLISAEILKERDKFRRFALSTIKTNLSKLKKEKYLRIGFRRQGRFSGSINLEGGKEYIRSVCYYKRY